MDNQINRGFLGSPKGVFMAVFDNADDPRALFESLRGRGVMSEQVVLLSPQDGDTLDTTDTSGPRILFRKMLGLEELEVEQSYAQALQEGKYVLQIHVPESDEDMRAHVEATLLAHHAQMPHYFGTLTYKNVAETTTSA
jgi:hypothetical protein